MRLTEKIAWGLLFLFLATAVYAALNPTHLAWRAARITLLCASFAVFFGVALENRKP